MSGRADLFDELETAEAAMGLVEAVDLHPFAGRLTAPITASELAAVDTRKLRSKLSASQQRELPHAVRRCLRQAPSYSTISACPAPSLGGATASALRKKGLLFHPGDVEREQRQLPLIAFQNPLAAVWYLTDAGVRAALALAGEPESEELRLQWNERQEDLAEMAGQRASRHAELTALAVRAARLLEPLESERREELREDIEGELEDLKRSMYRRELPSASSIKIGLSAKELKLVRDHAAAGSAAGSAEPVSASG